MFAENRINNKESRNSGRNTSHNANNNNNSESVADPELNEVDITINENGSLNPCSQILSRDSILTAKKQARTRNKNLTRT